MGFFSKLFGKKNAEAKVEEKEEGCCCEDCKDKAACAVDAPEAEEVVEVEADAAETEDKE